MTTSDTYTFGTSGWTPVNQPEATTSEDNLYTISALLDPTDDELDKGQRAKPIVEPKTVVAESDKEALTGKLPRGTDPVVVGAVVDSIITELPAHPEALARLAEGAT